MYQDHYTFVLVDRDNHGCDKFFTGTRGLPDDWAAYVFYNKNSVNHPREFPQGKFELVPTVIGKKSKAMGLSNSFLDIHYQCGKTLGELVAPEESKFILVAGEKMRFGELQAQLKAGRVAAEYYDGSSNNFGALLAANFIDTQKFYAELRQVPSRSRSQSQGPPPRRARSAYR
mmetsp:Transcript_140880/g.245465  ORF Transcript_140880/g.245465 Transcript_140880/m.245465 type:complete len:173 (-) Transcript_140880:118-636(-)